MHYYEKFYLKKLYYKKATPYEAEEENIRNLRCRID